MAKYNEKQMINEIRLLSLDMINNAKSGHPGIALSAAPMLYSLFTNHLVFDLKNPLWPNRDRFILSAGHGSALLYATLYSSALSAVISCLPVTISVAVPTVTICEYSSSFSSSNG